jgi:hypothetical protein
MKEVTFITEAIEHASHNNYMLEKIFDEDIKSLYTTDRILKIVLLILVYAYAVMSPNWIFYICSMMPIGLLIKDQ